MLKLTVASGIPPRPLQTFPNPPRRKGLWVAGGAGSRYFEAVCVEDASLRKGGKVVAGLEGGLTRVLVGRECRLD